MKTGALILAGIIFGIVSILQFVRFSKAWTLVIAHFTVPLQWSLYAGIFAAIVTILMFVAAAK
jgi:hypothetical protein